MEKKFEEIWNTLYELGYDFGDIIDYGELISACDANNYPHMSMQEVSDFEKKYNLMIEW